jgi:hypothetical protein
MSLPSILALDPGGSTGYFWRGPKKVPVYGELPPGIDGHHLALWKLLVECEDESRRHDSDAPFYIVCERFDFRKDDQRRDKIDYISREYIGVVRLYKKTSDHRVILRMQGSSEAKAFWTDDKLKRVDMYYTKSKHARDATRHFLYYVTFALKDDRYLRMLAR